MKKINFLFSLITATMLLWGMNVSAQTPIEVSSAAELQTAVNTLSSTGGTIILKAPFTNPTNVTGSPKWSAEALAIGNTSGSGVTLQADKPITIDCGVNKLTVYGTGSSGSAGNLIIGNNITVTGNGSVTIDNNDAGSAKGIIQVVNGGKVLNTKATGGTAVNASAGRSIVDPGASIITQSVDGIALKCGNSYSTIIRGGTIEANANGATAVLLSGTPATNFPAIGATIKAVGKNAVGIWAQDGWTIELQNLTIQTSSPDGSDVGLKAGDSRGLIYIKAGDGTAINSTIKYSNVGTGAVIDLRFPIIITANPGDGTTFPVNPGKVTLTAAYNDGNNTPVAANIAYKMGSAPAADAQTILNGKQVDIQNSGKLYAAVIGISTYSAGTPTLLLPNPAASFNYTITTIVDPPPTSPSLWQGKGRIVIGSDGNDHDNDDWSATPLSCAIIASQGLQDRLVVFAYSNHIWSNNHYYNGTYKAYDQMNLSALGARDWFGFDETISKFICAVDDPEVAYNAIRDEILKSSDDNPLFIMEGGPMQVVGEAINRAAAIDRSRLQYCTLISHSPWNNTHSDDPESWEVPKHTGWTWLKIQNTFSAASQGGLKMQSILNQNGVSGDYEAMKANRSKFTWLQNSPEKDKAPYYKTGSWDWLWGKMQLYITVRGGSTYDASDAGMPLWFVTGIEKTSPELLQEVMENPKPRLTAEPTSVKNPQADLFKISLDPFTGNIQVTGSETPRNIALYNIVGQKIAEGYNSDFIQASSLSAGNYIVKIVTNAGESKSYKICKK